MRCPACGSSAIREDLSEQHKAIGGSAANAANSSTSAVPTC